TLPGVTDGSGAQVDPSDWLNSIDTDHEWRADSRTARLDNFQFHASGMGAGTATWTFALPILQAGEYQVEAQWLADFHRTNSATYQIIFNGAVIDTVTVNQQLSPGENDGTGNYWKTLGTYALGNNGAGQLQVRLAQSANGQVVAGPIRLATPAG